MPDKENLEKMRKAAYSTDASGEKGEAEQVFFPKNAGEIRNKILLNEFDRFTIRGGGSGLMAGAVPNKTIIIDLSKMNRIMEIDLLKKEIEVEAGVILSELNEFLEQYNLEFPVVPMSEEIATIGGMIATNASGFREMRYGRTGNFLSSVEIANGKGEIIKLSRADLSDIAGMEGITGIITKAKLKLIEKKERSCSLYAIKNLEQAVEFARKLKLSMNVSAILFFDKICSSLLELKDNYHVLVEFETQEGRFKEEGYKEMIKMLRKAYFNLSMLGNYVLEDVKIFLERFPEISRYFEKEKIPFFADLGSGIIHPVFNENQKDLIAKVLEYIRRLHGKVSGKFGVGKRKKQYFDNIEKKLLERIKIRYDPNFRINPDVMIDARKEINEQGGEEMKRIKLKQDEIAEKRAERNIEETEKELSRELKHDEEIGESKIEDELSELSKEEE